jgi:hypothetical protein
MVLFDLLVLHRVVPSAPIRKVEVRFYNGPKTSKYLDEYFKKTAIVANHMGFRSNNYSSDTDKRIYTSLYKVKLPKNRTYSQIITDLAKNKDIIQIHVISM